MASGYSIFYTFKVIKIHPMSEKLQLTSLIKDLQESAWNSQGEEKRIKLNELILLYDKLIPLEEDSYLLYEEKARMLSFLKKWDQAIDAMKEGLIKHPTSVIGWWMLSEAYFETGNYVLALEAIDNCIKNEFVSDHRYEMRAKINRALGDTAAAEKDQKLYDDYQAREKEKWGDPNHYYHYK